MSGEQLILEELQTQTEILEDIYFQNQEMIDSFDFYFSIFPPLIFIYVVFGLFFRRK